MENMLDNILKIGRMIAIVAIFLMTLILTSCENSHSVYIGYKNSNANYGLYTAFYNGKIYFKDSSEIFAVDPKKNIVDKVCSANIDGQLFFVDQNTAYIIDFNDYPCHRCSHFEISSIKLDGSDQKKVAEYHNAYPQDDEAYYVHNGLVYLFGSNTCFKGSGTVLGDLYNIPTGANTFISPDDSFTVYVSNNKIFARESTSSFLSLYDKDTNMSIPYNTSSPTILSYSEGIKLGYIYRKSKIYKLDNAGISLFTSLTPLANDNSGQLLLSAENSDLLYLVSGSLNNKQQLFSVAEKTGYCKQLYVTKENCENIVALTDQYFVVYKNGYLYKYNIVNGAVSEKSKLAIGKGNFDFEQSQNYLYVQNNRIVNVINLKNMSELLLPDK